MSETQASLARMAIRAALILGLAWIGLAYGVIYKTFDPTKDTQYILLLMAGVGGGEGAAALTKLVPSMRRKDEPEQIE